MLMGTDSLPVLVTLWLRPSLRSSVCPNTFPRFPFFFHPPTVEHLLPLLKRHCLWELFFTKCWVFSFNVFDAYISGLDGRASEGQSHQYCHPFPVLGQFWSDVQYALIESLSLAQRMSSRWRGSVGGETKYKTVWSLLPSTNKINRI